VIRRKTFPLLVLVRGPRRSIDKLAKGSDAGNNLSMAVRSLDAILFLAQDAQLATQSHTSASRDSQ